MSYDLQDLISQSIKAYGNAYCPYSKYQVGCAIVTSCGKVFSGANIENASYGLTICAERSAFVTAVSAGYKTFQAVVVTTRDGGSCCGACRQFLREFLTPEVPIIFTRADGTIAYKTDMATILPNSFGPENVGQPCLPPAAAAAPAAAAEEPAVEAAPSA